MKHEGPCLTAGNDRECRVSTVLRSCEARASLLKCQERPRKQFLPLWRPCGACLCAGKTLQCRFNRRGCAVKHVQSCSSASTLLESSFHHCGRPMFKSQEKPTKQF